MTCKENRLDFVFLVFITKLVLCVIVAVYKGCFMPGAYQSKCDTDGLDAHK